MSIHECCPRCAEFVAGWDDDTEWLLEFWGGCCCVDTADKARAAREASTPQCLTKEKP